MVTSACRPGERPQQSIDVFRAEQGLVSLDVDVDIGVDQGSDGMHPVSAAGQRRQRS